MLRVKTKSGFTLIELTISMLFVAILSIAIVLIINNTISSYQRGLTLSRVNTVGSDLIDDLRGSVQNSTTSSLLSSCYMAIYGSDGKAMEPAERTKCAEDDAYYFVSVTKTTNSLKINGKSVGENVPIYGAFCTGTYSYVWNSGYYFADNATFDEKTNNAWAWVNYTDYSSGKNTTVEIGHSEKFRLIKLYDTRRLVCASAGVKKDGTGVRETYMIRDLGNEFKVSSLNYGVLDLGEGAIIEQGRNNNKSVKVSSIDLLPADSGNDLAVYDLSVAKPALSMNGENVFYSVSLILGTVNNGVNITASGSGCATPSDYNDGNFNYCAINKFNFAAQINGG